VRNSLPSGVVCISDDIFGDCMENTRENQHDIGFTEKSNMKMGHNFDSRL